MADLWGALEENEPKENPTITVAIKTPDTIVVQDLINNGKIQTETKKLRTALDCSARIVVATYKVADYVPNLTNADHHEFWEVQVSFNQLSLTNSDVINIS